MSKHVQVTDTSAVNVTGNSGERVGRLRADVTWLVEVTQDIPWQAIGAPMLLNVEIGVHTDGEQPQRVKLDPATALAWQGLFAQLDLGGDPLDDADSDDVPELDEQQQ
jgi:hypothetical protein